MCPTWSCGCCHEIPSSPRPAWQCGMATADCHVWLWAGAVPGCHGTDSTLCCIRPGWKWTSPVPRAKQEQISQAAAAQAPEKFENRAGKRTGTDPGKYGRAGQGPMQRSSGLGSLISCNGNQLRVQEGHQPCQSTAKTDGFPFCLLQHFPLRP